MNSRQQAFLQHIGTLIPKLFDAIRLGNVKSECVLGDRIIGQRQVRLKLVAEVVDPGNNPLATHSQSRQSQVQALENAQQPNQPGRKNQSTLSNQDKPIPPRRGSKRKDPMSR